MYCICSRTVIVLQSRGPDFAVFNGTLLGSLLELLVVRGGAAGTVEAITIVDTCHAKGCCHETCGACIQYSVQLLVTIHSDALRQ